MTTRGARQSRGGQPSSAWLRSQSSASSALETHALREEPSRSSTATPNVPSPPGSAPNHTGASLSFTYPKWYIDLSSRHQTNSTPYSPNSGSADTSDNPSSRACAISSRSHGSRCTSGSRAANSACASDTGKGANPCRSSVTARSSGTPCSLPRPYFSRSPYPVTALAQTGTTFGRSAARAVADSRGSSASHHSNAWLSSSRLTRGGAACGAAASLPVPTRRASASPGTRRDRPPSPSDPARSAARRTHPDRS